jgi:hypothetical protein
MSFRTCLAAFLLAAAGAGCVSLKPVVLARKTQLENQVLGSFQRLERDMILASSVRGERPAPKLTPLQREAVEAMMSRAFNKDDIDALKQEQVVGEAKTGKLQILAPPKEPALAKRVTRLVEQENRDREVIIRRVVQTNAKLSDRDLPAVWRIFYRLNLQTAQPGDKVQREAGNWEVRRRAGGGGK